MRGKSRSPEIAPQAPHPLLHSKLSQGRKPPTRYEGGFAEGKEVEPPEALAALARLGHPDFHAATLGAKERHDAVCLTDVCLPEDEAGQRVTQSPSHADAMRK